MAKKKGKKVIDTVKKDLQKIENTIKKDVSIVKEDIKKAESNENFNFFLTYGWAIILIIIGIVGLVWWQFFNIHNETCDFVQGSGLICEKFDANNESISFEIRNLNNETIKVTQIKVNGCSLIQEKDIPDNDKRTFVVPCNVSSGPLSKKIIVLYNSGDFKESAVGKIRKIVP